MVPTLCTRLFACCAALAVMALPPAQDPAPPKDADKEAAEKAAKQKKEIADKIALLKEVVADKKFERDAEGVQAIDDLLMKSEGVDPKDKKDIVKAFEHVLSGGKVRPHTKIELYVGAAAALGKSGAEGSKALQAAYANGTRYPKKPEWVPLREHLAKNLGRTKDEAMVKFLTDEACRSPEAALQAAAGEALGNFEESKDTVRKEIVGDMIAKWGELSEKASQLGTNMEAQNAQDRLAAIQDKWTNTLSKLTRQNLGKFLEWQQWYNKNKAQPWP